jgi:hypothetical protein
VCVCVSRELSFVWVKIAYHKVWIGLGWELWCVCAGVCARVCVRVRVCACVFFHVR